MAVVMAGEFVDRRGYQKKTGPRAPRAPGGQWPARQDGVRRRRRVDGTVTVVPTTWSTVGVRGGAGRRPVPAAGAGRPTSMAVRRRRAVLGATMGVISVLGVGWAWLGHAGSPATGTAGGAAGGEPLTATGSPTASSPGATGTVKITLLPVSARVWVVRPGDTLWTIVEASGYRGDPRPVVDALAAQLGGRPLQPGERLILP